MAQRPTHYDISPKLSPRTAVFPGDREFSRQVSVDYNNGLNFLLSEIRTTVHIGAHADAPNHYQRGGADIASRGLEPYLGECQIFRVCIPRGERVRPQHLSGPVRARRVLLSTGSFPDPDRWNGDFNSLSAELVHWLADQGVTLVGIDTPSIDPEQDKLLESHQAVAARDLSVLEGVVLEHVPEGVYKLVALPLPIEGGDASPVRAVLLTEEWKWS